MVSKKDFINNVKRLRKAEEEIGKAEDALKCTLFEGPIGTFLDLIWTYMLPENPDDKTFEAFGNLVYSGSDEEIADFYNKHIKGE